MPKINGVLETCLYVEDVAHASAFYTRVFGFMPMTEDERIAAIAADLGVSVAELHREIEMVKMETSGAAG